MGGWGLALEVRAAGAFGTYLHLIARSVRWNKGGGKVTQRLNQHIGWKAFAT